MASAIGKHLRLLINGVGMKSAIYKSVLVTVSALCLFLGSSYQSSAKVVFHEDCAEAREVKLPIYEWEDNDKPARGVVLLIHGITQRAYSLNALATKLASDGFLVYGIDQRGHGWWHFENKKGCPGYKCNFKQTVKDVDAVLPLFKDVHPDLPVFLIGESCGAGVAIRSAAKAPDMVNGVVLAGAGCKAGRAKFSWVAGDVLASMLRFNHPINVVRYQRKYGTDDLPALEENLKDKWQRPTLTMGEIMSVGSFVKHNAKYAKRLDPNTSMLVVQGMDDKVLRPKSAEKVLASAPCLDKEIVEVPGCGHILIGTNHLKPIVGDSITTWLEDRVSNQAVAAAPNPASVTH